jgi:hypothetical protein
VVVEFRAHGGRGNQDTGNNRKNFHAQLSPIGLIKIDNAETSKKGGTAITIVLCAILATSQKVKVFGI